MFLITNPSAIRFRGNLAKCCYNCPVCDFRLSKRMPSNKLVKVFLYWLPLKKYECSKCLKSYYVYVKIYRINAAPAPSQYAPDSPIKLGNEISPQKRYKDKEMLFPGLFFAAGSLEELG